MTTIELRVCGRYKLLKRIGVGTFGQIYLAKNIQTNTEVAIKMEEIKTKHPQLLYEGKIYQSLQGGIGIPTMHWCGQEGDYNFLVMELLGNNLQELFVQCGNKFSLKTVLMVADQIISNLEFLHFKYYIHRDMKPENLILGSGKRSNQILIIDFGLSKRYRDSKSFEHIQFREGKQLIGTARYASIDSHRGYEQSRKDDLESLCYMLIYFLNGKLPWQGIEIQNKDEKYEKIKELKLNFKNSLVYKSIPPEFQKFLEHCRSLKFEQKPDYSYLKKILKERFIKEGYCFDYIYDWNLIPLRNKMPELITKQIQLHIEIIPNENMFLKDIVNLNETKVNNQNEDNSYDFEEDIIEQNLRIEKANQQKKVINQQVQEQKQIENQAQSQVDYNDGNFQEMYQQFAKPLPINYVPYKQKKKEDCSIF